jgi:hypothetical protein
VIIALYGVGLSTRHPLKNFSQSRDRRQMGISSWVSNPEESSICVSIGTQLDGDSLESVLAAGALGTASKPQLRRYIGNRGAIDLVAPSHSGRCQPGCFRLCNPVRRKSRNVVHFYTSIGQRKELKACPSPSTLRTGSSATLHAFAMFCAATSYIPSDQR